MRSPLISPLLLAASWCTITLVVACGDQATLSPPQPSPELEGPRGQVTSAGPWVVRAFLPDADPSVSLALELSLEEGEWEVLPPLTLSPSARPELWLAALPLLSPERSLRYRLSTREETLGGPYAWRELSFSPRGPVDNEQSSCELTLLDPQAEQLLNSGDDAGQASGLQYRILAALTVHTPQTDALPDAITHAVKLSVNLDTDREQIVMELTEGGLVALPPVTLIQGAQRAQLEGYTAQGAYCVKRFTTSVE